MAKVDRQVIIDFLISSLQKGEKRAIVLGKAGEKWAISRTSFDRLWKVANDQLKERIEKAKQEADKVFTQETINSTLQGLKTKNERLLILQREVDSCLAELYPVKEKGKRSAKPLNTLQKVMLRKTIRDLQAEISKIEGDYAPSKIAATDKDGNDVIPITKVEIINSENEEAD